MEGLEDEVLDALKQGQEVEVLCHYTGVWEKDDDEHGRYSGFLYRFVGLEVHPIQ
jgi:hypothetical protein